MEAVAQIARASDWAGFAATDLSRQRPRSPQNARNCEASGGRGFYATASMPSGGPRSALPTFRSVSCPTCCSTSPAVAIAGDDAGLQLRPTPAQQGPPLSRRSADRRGDRRRHAPGRHHAARLADARPDRRALARRVAHPRSARAHRGRPRRPPRRSARPPRQGRPPREVGMDYWAWNNSTNGSTVRVELPVGPLVCILTGATRGRAWSGRRPRTTAPDHGARGRPATIRAAPAPPRPRRRDGARGCPADRHPTPTRPHQPRHHLDLPPGHRQRRDHRHRPRPPGTSGAGQQHAAAGPRPAAGRRPKGQPSDSLLRWRCQAKAITPAGARAASLSAPRLAIVVRLVFALGIVGMIEASQTQRRSSP